MTAATNLRDLLHAHGLRATTARLAILAQLERAPRPRSHAELVARLPARHDRTTIFRALAALVRARLVHRIAVGDRVWRYRRARGELVATFACRACGRLDDLPGVTLQPRALAARASEVLVRGICDRCSQAA